ncbi:MAG: hypothetical protein K0S54_2238 [Alphaproteobacteria bacterium]|nr:hypothetical protein [Alphaproteobacteria bacterium]
MPIAAAAALRFNWRTCAKEDPIPDSSLTADLPPQQTGPAAWYGPAVAAREDWIVPLEPADIAEIDAAMAPLLARNADIAAVKAEDFPLPRLKAKLDATLHELLHGRGFVVLRGLPVERYDRGQAALAFFGLGAHLGRARSQNAIPATSSACCA